MDIFFSSVKCGQSLTIDDTLSSRPARQTLRPGLAGSFWLIVVAVLGWGAGIPPALAQYNLLHPFNNTSNGGNPVGGLTLSGSTLYGLASTGGSMNGGTAFTLNSDGTGYTVLHNFGSGSDGVSPQDALTLSGSTLYGMTAGGGSSGLGALFTINTNGTGYAILHSFGNGSDGVSPQGALTLSGSALYGMTRGGGSSGLGALFTINTNGTGYAVLHNFTGGSPVGSLTLSGSTLYGMTESGGSYGLGVLFKINLNGTGFMILYNFGGATPAGGSPVSSLTLSGATLYGMLDGGSNQDGMVFKINTDGTGFNLLHNFGGADGAFPAGALTLSGSTLYGMTANGGSSGYGVVFAINTDGTGFTVLHNFAGADGAFPAGALTLSGATLYGVTSGGVNNNELGVLFSLAISGGCRYFISPASAAYGAGGGSGSVTVTTGSGCGWTATSNAGWIDITSNNRGTGNGTVNYSVTASSRTNSQAGTLLIAGQLFTVTQTVPTAPTITTAPALPGGIVEDTYHTTLVASGGLPPYTWLVTAGSLPPGLELDLASGSLTGTPTTVGPANFTVRVTGNDGLFSEAFLSLIINRPPPTITTASLLPAGILGVGYSQDLLATGGTLPYNWSVNPAQLPTGLSLIGSRISGTPLHKGQYEFTVSCSDSNGLAAQKVFFLKITQPVATPTITPAGGTFTNSIKVTLGCTTPGARIYYTTNGTNPTTRSTRYRKTALVLTNSCTLIAEALTGDSSSATARAAFTTIVSPPPNIATTNLLDATVKQKYTALLQIIPGTGVGPFRWSLARKSKLPAGLTLNTKTGVLSGQPTTAGTFSFVVDVTDVRKQIGTQALSLTVASP